MFIACVWIPFGVPRFKKQSFMVICSFVDNCCVAKIYVCYGSAYLHVELFFSSYHDYSQLFYVL